MADKYSRGRELGKGTFAVVFEGIRRCDSKLVAIKQMKGQEISGGVDFTGLREIKYLQSLRGGPNIVDLVDIFILNDDLCLVLEHCPYDLEKVIRDKKIFLRSHHHKSYLQMLLRGVEHCHTHFVLHRDLKPANLLFSPTGDMKIADFGLARSHSSPLKMTHKVVTTWYRAPELLFGANYYAGGVDMWAVGCIFAEIVLRTPLFPGDTEMDQLAKIFNILGTPTDDSWPNVRLLPSYVEFEYREAMNLTSLFRGDDSGSSASSSLSGAGSGAGAAEHKKTTTPTATGSRPPVLDLLLKMLTLNPSKRITASEALQHPYLTHHHPAPCSAAELPIPTGVIIPVTTATTGAATGTTTAGTGGSASGQQQQESQSKPDIPQWKKQKI